MAEGVGNEAAAAGNARGWFKFSSQRPVLSVRDFVVIPQHAKGEPLAVAWGEVLCYNDAGTRVRYDTTTEEGSSGSPCLTVDLDIFGLHHAAGKNRQFNQAIPFDMIARDLQQNNKDLVLG